MCTNTLNEMLQFLTVSDKGALAECCSVFNDRIKIDVIFDRYELQFKYSKENLLKQITYLYNANLKHFKYIEVDTPNISYLMHNLHGNSVIDKVLDNLSNEMLEIKLLTPSIDVLSSNYFIKFLQRIRPTKFIIEGEILFPTNKLNSNLFTELSVVILNILVQNIHHLIFSNIRYDYYDYRYKILFQHEQKQFVNNKHDNDQISVLKNCKHFNCLKLENTNWFIMKLILSKISLKNLTTLCLDVVNFENKIKYCNWLQSNIFIPNLIEFCFTDSVFISGNYNDIGRDLISYILFKHRTQLLKIGINQCRCLPKAQNRFNIYKHILLQMKQLRTIQYTQAITQYYKANVYDDTIFKWLLHLIDDMDKKEIFCVCFCLFNDNMHKVIRNDTAFEILFGKYIKSLTHSLNIKTNGRYFISAQLTQDNVSIYKLDSNIISTVNYAVYDGFGEKITEKYQNKSSRHRHSQYVTLFGTNFPSNVFVEDYRIQNDFSWNKQY